MTMFSIDPAELRPISAMRVVARYDRVRDHLQVISEADKARLIEEQGNDRIAALMAHLDHIVRLAVDVGGAELKVTIRPYLDGLHVVPFGSGFVVQLIIDQRDRNAAESAAA